MVAGFACAAASSVLAALRLLTGAPSLRLVRRLPGTSAAWAREWAPVIAQIKRIHRLRKMKRHGLKGTRSFIIGYLRRTGHKAAGPLCEDPSSGIETRKASESIQNWIKRPRTKVSFPLVLWYSFLPDLRQSEGRAGLHSGGGQKTIPKDEGKAVQEVVCR